MTAGPLVLSADQMPGEQQHENKRTAPAAPAASDYTMNNTVPVIATPPGEETASTQHKSEVRLAWSPGAGRWRQKFASSPEAPDGPKQTNSSPRRRGANARRKRSKFMEERLAETCGPPFESQIPAWNVWPWQHPVDCAPRHAQGWSSQYREAQNAHALAALNAFVAMQCQEPEFDCMAPMGIYESRNEVIAHSVLHDQLHTTSPEGAHVLNKPYLDQEQHAKAQAQSGIPQPHLGRSTLAALDDTWSYIVFRTESAEDFSTRSEGIQHQRAQEEGRQEVIRRLGGVLDVQVQQKRPRRRERRMTMPGRLC